MVKTLPFAGIRVPVPGFGAMGITSFMSTRMSAEQAEPVLLKAVELGCTFWDTAVAYDAGLNEKILGDFIRTHNVRDKVFDESYINGTIERLSFAPDLYYLHRIDPKTPLQESIGTLEELRKEGKTKYIGLSECSAKTLGEANSSMSLICENRRCSSRYSAFETIHETTGLIETAKELDVAFVAFSPPGHGWLVDDFPFQSPDDFAPDDFRRTSPKFQRENFYKNKAIADETKGIAATKGCTLAQLALAWVAAQDMITIPGTTKVKRLDENWASREVELSEDEISSIRKIADANKPVGERFAGPRAAAIGH
ncbi:Aldo-keto reductase yakc [NADP(+)] [Colletotrichum tanaceti]|uniref:Aldo-keto reductase yakc [NADP(+)] n=1 Tax=Colletotrichum tanaceti TaxID=1306861 RepID=A0A4U6XW28_9PEZI|nr:Aldo-keto reductase yakc [NADP(+)] [Colletotrichum tanaceti]TKW60277.1 Aldo-keto reductase yakc [NADP(+)] [Colletotrichum tanaceti]